MSSMKISVEIAARIAGDAKAALDESFGAFVDQRLDRLRRSEQQNEVAQVLIRHAMNEQKLPKLHSHLAPQEALTALQVGNRGRLDRKLRHSPGARALTIRPFGGAAAGELRVAEDARLQILVPPYQWTSKSGNGNRVTNVNADAQTGAFGFLDGAAGGSAACGAGVWAQFIPDAPLPRWIQVRAYTPYDYQWHDSSQAGYTAHNDGGFGIYVLSWDLAGTDRRLEQDYRYSIWSDGTGWWDDHASWPLPDYGYAYQYGNEAPYFEAQPGRVYRACIWCFGSCDAGSGYFGNAFSDADINANVGFVVIGEQ
jgi:hypothetical protein